MSDAAPKHGEYQDGKLWFHRKGSMVTVGLTLSAIEDIGSVESVELPEEGEDFEKGNVVATVDGTNGSLEIITPASGVVQEINETAKDNAEVITDDPLEEGWLLKLEIQDASDLSEFIN